MSSVGRGHRVVEEPQSSADAEPVARLPAADTEYAKGSAAWVLNLQQSIGNRAVNSMLARAQAKLEVGGVDDAEEREADAIAASVVRALEHGVEPSQSSDGRMRRRPDARAGSGDGESVDASTEGAVRAARQGGSPMPAVMRSEMEDAFRHDFSEVRLHAGRDAAGLSEHLHAKAFTIGNDIFFRGAVPDRSRKGRELLAHELTHTLQQRGGVQRKIQRLFGGYDVVCPADAKGAELIENDTMTPKRCYREVSSLSSKATKAAKQPFLFSTLYDDPEADNLPSAGLPSWGSEQTSQVADHLGLSRLKDMTSVLGDDAVGKLRPAELRKVRCADSSTVLSDVAALVVKLGQREATDRLPLLATRWSVPLEALLPAETLLQLLRGALSHLAKLRIDQLRPAITAAPAQQRQDAASDNPLLALAKRKLDEENYLELLPALGVHKQPTKPQLSQGGTAHMSGPDADKAIRQHLQQYVVDAVRAGRKVEGEVSVVGDEDFQMAFDRQWVRAAKQAFPGRKAWEVCNAFVDVNLPKRRIWVHRDMGDTGVVIHEGMHKYADSLLRDEEIALCQRLKIAYGGISQLDEGITEYFTRKVVAQLPIQQRVNYENPFLVAGGLVARCTEQVVAAAYYDGKFDALKQKFGLGAWPAFAEALEQKNWSWLTTNGYM